MNKLLPQRSAGGCGPIKTSWFQIVKLVILACLSSALGTSAFGQAPATNSGKPDAPAESLQTYQQSNPECPGKALQSTKETSPSSFCGLPEGGYRFAGAAVPSKRAGFVPADSASADEAPNIATVRPEIEPGKTSAAPGAAETPAEIEGHERILFVVPAFGVTNRQDAPPLSATQKFRLVSRQVFDPFVWISTGIQAGISQANNEFPEYGQGTAGYTRRYGAAMLDTVHAGFAATAFCVLLKEDPRYFRLGQGPIVHRVLYSMSQEFIAKSDNGKRTFNWANVLGTFASGAISNAYYPRPNRGFGLTMNRCAVGLAWGFTGELAEEFWPDVKRKLFHRSPKT